MIEGVTGYGGLIPQVWGWDLVYFGALGALAWGALATTLFVRKPAMVVLTLLCLDMLFFGLAVRGYMGLLLPAAAPWIAAHVNVFGHTALALYVLTFCFLARQERIALPGEQVLRGLAALQFAAGAVIVVAPGFARLGSPLLNVATMALLVSISIVMARRRIPSASLMLLTNLLLAFRFAVSIAERLGIFPALEHTEHGLMRSPLVSILGLLLNLTLLAAWVAYVGKQRREANDALAAWQAQEKIRLETEVARQTLALNQALQYANEANRRKTEGLGYISHDLRAPLASILGYAELLTRSQIPAQQPHIQAIIQSATYQLALIDDLLEYTRTELESFVLYPEPLSLSGLMEDISRSASVFSARQHNQFRYVAETPLPEAVMADGRRLQQVLLNLLVNASKFTRRGVITLSVGASYGETGWILRFSVADTGIGMSPDTQARVFNAYAQADPQRGGVGLGLFIARQIVQAMGGQLALESAVGTGSCFSFEIAVPEADAALVPATPDMAGTGWGQSEAEGGEPGDRQQLPPAHARVELAILARDGQLTKIEAWLSAMGAAYPGCESFFSEISAALQTLDLEYIEAMALTSEPEPPEIEGRSGNDALYAEGQAGLAEPVAAQPGPPQGSTISP